MANNFTSGVQMMRWEEKQKTLLTHILILIALLFFFFLTDQVNIHLE